MNDTPSKAGLQGIGQQLSYPLDYDTQRILAQSVNVQAFPIGAVFISVVSTDPSSLLGYGTWSAFGAGKVLVGLDSGDADFDTAEETGGEKEHTLTIAEMPSHNHPEDGTYTYSSRVWYGPGADTNGAGTGSATNTTLGIIPQGGGGAHNNLAPYIVCFFWKRVS